MATASNEEFYEHFLADLCKKAGIEPSVNTPKGVEAAFRENANGTFLFLLNHTDEGQEVEMNFNGTDLIHQAAYKQGDTLLLAAKDVMILQISNQ